MALPVSGKRGQRLGNHCEGATGSGETTVLGETTKLNGAVAGTGNLINGVRHIRLADVGLIGGIVKQDGAVFSGIGNPIGQLLATCDGTRRIVGEAEVDHIDLLIALCGNRRDKTIFCRALQIGDSLIGSVLSALTRVTRHDIRVDIDWIDGIHDSDLVVISQNIEDRSSVALGTIGNKDLIIGNLQSAIPIIMLRNGCAEEFISLLRTIAMESLARPHLIDGGMHGLAHRSGKRLSDISDPTTNHSGGSLRITLRENFHAPGDLGKKITGLEFEIVGIERRHRADK